MPEPVEIEYIYPMIRKCISLGMISLLLFHSAGFYIFFSAGRQLARREMKTRLKASVPERDLFSIILYPGDSRVQWEESDKEFFLGGELYDVVSSVPQPDGSVLYRCLHDKQEQRLFAGLDTWVKNSSRESRPGAAPALRMYGTPYTLCIPPAAPAFLPEQHSFIVSSREKNHSVFSAEVPVPPPRTA